MFVVKRFDEIFEGIKVDKYMVKDPLLLDCIGVGRGDSLSVRNRVQGFNSGKRFGYALLASFTSRALAIHRLPYHDDYHCRRFYYLSEDDEAIVQGLDNRRVNDILEELRGIYCHTQRHLKGRGLAQVNLRREINGSQNGYHADVIISAIAVEIAGLNYIDVDMDFLNSFGDAGEYNFGKGMTLELSIPVQDVFYCHGLISSENKTYKLVERGEWVVINRSPTGVVKVPIECVLLSDKARDEFKSEIKSISAAEKYLNERNPRMPVRRF